MGKVTPVYGSGYNRDGTYFLVFLKLFEVHESGKINSPTEDLNRVIWSIFFLKFDHFNVGFLTLLLFIA